MPFTESERINAQHALSIAGVELPRVYEAISILGTESARIEERSVEQGIAGNTGPALALDQESTRLDRLADDLRETVARLEDLIEEAKKELSK